MPSPVLEGQTLAERARQAAELLESIIADRGLLAHLPEEERTRLLAAAGQASRPDAMKRRQLVKEAKRQRKQDKVRRAESVLTETGIRRARREAMVAATKNIFAPVDFEQRTIDDEPREIHETQNCYICKQDFSEVHFFYDQLCPTCAAFNYAKRTETADLSGRVALLTGGRVKIGYQAGLKLLRAGA